MSGNFVQRGDAAVLGKFARAEAALRGGADLVLELPTPWACAGAQRFAAGGVGLLAALGVVSHIAFGSESGDLRAMTDAARLTLDEKGQRAHSRIAFRRYGICRRASARRGGGGPCGGRPPRRAKRHSGDRIYPRNS